MKYLLFFILFIFGICFSYSSAQANQCSIIFNPRVTARDLLKALVKQLSTQELKQIEEDVVNLEAPNALRSLLNPDWGELERLSKSDANYYSLQPHFQSFRLQPDNVSDNSPTLHFIYRNSNSLGRIIGPRFALVAVILGPYNLNRIDLNTQALEVQSYNLRRILFQWSRERDPEVSTVGYRDVGI